MKWQGRRKSTNINDQRGRTSGGGRRVAMGGGSLGLAGIIIYLLVSLLGGGNLGDIFGGIPGDTTEAFPQQRQVSYQQTSQEKQLFDYLSVVLADIEDTWNEILPASKYRTRYVEPAMTI